MREREGKKREEEEGRREVEEGRERVRVRAVVFEIVYDCALRRALFFSACSFLLPVRGVRLRSLHGVNTLLPCPSFSLYLFFSVPG